MAQTNKYTSINFNHIYDKTNSSSNSNSSTNPIKTPSSAPFSYSAISAANTKSHGGRSMLVLTRPTPKPISIPAPQPKQLPLSDSDSASASASARSEPASDPISLRPLGRTGGSGGSGSPIVSPVALASKPDKFVPPHLRPGFAGREERPGPEVIRSREMGQRYFGSPGRYVEEDRPKSGGGHERIRRGGESDLGILNRPRSSGNRPSSSGW